MDFAVVQKGMASRDDEMQATIENIEKPLPIIDIMGVLLVDGFSKVCNYLQDEWDCLINKIGEEQIMLEAAIWFTLYCVKCQIELFWYHMSPVTQEFKHRNEKNDAEELKELFKRKEVVEGLIFGFTSVGQRMEPEVCSFLGL